MWQLRVSTCKTFFDVHENDDPSLQAPRFMKRCFSDSDILLPQNALQEADVRIMTIAVHVEKDAGEAGVMVPSQAFDGGCEDVCGNDERAAQGGLIPSTMGLVPDSSPKPICSDSAGLPWRSVADAGMISAEAPSLRLDSQLDCSPKSPRSDTDSSKSTACGGTGAGTPITSVNSEVDCSPKWDIESCAWGTDASVCMGSVSPSFISEATASFVSEDSGVQHEAGGSDAEKLATGDQSETRRRHRPCKGKRMRLRKLTTRLIEHQQQFPEDNFEAFDMPPCMVEDGFLRQKILASVRSEVEAMTAEVAVEPSM